MKNKGKYLALILRHDPSKGNVTMDKNGWVFISDLINNAGFSMKELLSIVSNDDKGRYEINVDKSKIRAVQGHSLEVVVDLVETNPPDFLYHGTKEDFLPLILVGGIKKMNRLHVHLSQDKNTAISVAYRRKGNSVILKILSKEMFNDGYKFYKSKNNVWLTNIVPVKYIEIDE